MKSLNNFLATLHREESGQGLVEYVLILALVALGAVATMQTLGQDINNAFTAISKTLTTYAS
jgi:pilus assembly protein Flp/PilA